MPWFITALYVAAGALLMAAAVPLIRRRVPPNAWYGVRLPATFADEAVWYEVNARSGRELLVLGAAVVLLALAVPALLPAWPAERQALVPVAVVLASTLLLTLRAWRHAARLLQERRQGGAAGRTGAT